MCQRAAPHALNPCLMLSAVNRVRIALGSYDHNFCCRSEQCGIRGSSCCVTLCAPCQHMQCYTPYTGCTSGVAIITSAGKVYSGGYVESAAFNPSLTPFHAAWAAAVTDHVSSAQVCAQLVYAYH